MLESRTFIRDIQCFNYNEPSKLLEMYLTSPIDQIRLMYDKHGFVPKLIDGEEDTDESRYIVPLEFYAFDDSQLRAMYMINCGTCATYAMTRDEWNRVRNILENK